MPAYLPLLSRLRRGELAHPISRRGGQHVPLCSLGEPAMADKLNVVTGASGFLGSHIVEQLVAHGERVRAVVRLSRAASPRAPAFLEGLGVEIANAELADRPALRKAVGGATIVYHCAARVTDWGPWRAFKADTIEGARNILEACKAEGVSRVLCVSSLSVFGCKLDGGLVTEESPFAS